jgi:hypothetical protein
MTEPLELVARAGDGTRFVGPDTEAANRLRAEARVDPPKKETQGAKVVVDNLGLVSQITRANGTVIDCIYNGRVLTQINETRNGRTTEWKKDANEDRWRSMDYIGAQRINYRVNDLGQTSFQDVSGTKYTTNGDGSQSRRKADGSTIEIDKAWHVSSVTRADGSQIKCSFNGGTLSEIEETSGKNKSTWKYDAAKEQWTSGQSNEVRRNVSVSDLGNYAYISARNSDVVHIDYADGNNREFEWKNGTVTKIGEKTPSGTVTWTRDGATDTFISGQTKEERKNVAVSLNGDFSYTDKAGYKHIHKFDVTEEVILPNDMARSKAVQDARDDLLTSAKKALNAGDLAKFTFDLDKFEERAHSMALKEDQVRASMDGLKKLMETTVQKPFVEKERLKLAEETLQHIAYPRGIDQGYHDTCGAATGEVYVATLYPDKFVAVVREVADSGQFTTTAGLVVKPNDGSLREDWEAKNRSPYANDAWGRSYASQIFQVIGINAAYQALGYDRRYEQGRPQNPKDTGERTVNNINGAIGSFGGMFDSEVIALTKQTSGHEVTILRRGTQFTTADELGTNIGNLQKQHQLPAVLWVSTKNEPFWTATGQGRGGGVPGGHYVTLWDMDTSGKVLVDNQWGRTGDYESLRRLSLKQVFDAGAP